MLTMVSEKWERRGTSGSEIHRRVAPAPDQSNSTVCVVAPIFVQPGM